MNNEPEIRRIVEKVLREENLHNFIKIFEKEHNLFRGSHDRIGLPEALEIHQTIINHIVEKFEDEAITTDMIADGAILNKKLYDACVDANKIADEAITEAKIAAEAVSEAKIAVGAIVEAKVAADAITEEKIANAAIVASKIGGEFKILEILDSLPDAGTAGRLVYLTTDNKIYRDNGTAWVELIMPADVYKHLGGTDIPTVDTDAIADTAIETAKIANAAVEEAKLASSAVTEGKVADNAITTAKLINEAVSAAKIAARAVEEAKIAIGAATEDKIGAAAITVTKIADDAVETAKIKAGAIIAGKIASGAVETDKLAALAVTAAKIAAGTITASEINVADFIALPSDENLVGYLSFDEGSGTLAVDGSGNDNDGTLYPTPVPISPCDATTDWTTSEGGSLSVDTDDKKEGTGSLKNTVAEPTIDTAYQTIYNPTGSWDWSAKKHILFWLKCDRAHTVFSLAELVIRDTLNNWRAWNVTFSAGEWTAFKFLLSTGDGESGTPPDLALIDKVYIQFKAADTIPFYKKIDDLRIDDRPQWAASAVSGKCLDFDGENDCVSIGDVIPTLTEGSLLIWFRRDENKANYQMLFTDALSQLEICFIDNNLYFYVNSVVLSAGLYTDANWHHIVGVFSQTGNYHKVYVDGEYVNGSTYPGDATAETRYIGSRNGSYGFHGLIDEVRIYNRALTESEIKALYLYPAGNKAVRISGGQIAANTVTAEQLVVDFIDTDQLVAGAVTTEKIAALAVEAGKIAAGAISAGKIATGAVTTLKLDALAVTTEKIAALAVEAGKIAVNTITADQMAANSIDTDELVAGSVTVDILAANAVIAEKIASDAIIARTIKAGEITTVKLEAGCVTTEKIYADAVTAPKIDVVGLDGATGRICVVDDTDADEIVDGINAHALTLIEAGKILISGETDLSDWRHGVDATLIDGGKIYTQSITAAQILAGCIDTDQLAAGAVTAEKIAAGTITAEEIFAGTITADKLVLGQRQYWYSIPSATTRNNNDAEKETSSTTYVKLKEIKLNEDTGKMRIYFEIKISEAGKHVLAKIYKNGSPLGTERDWQGAGYEPYTEDLGPFSANDLIQIYVKRVGLGSPAAYVANMRLQYDRAVSIAAGHELSTGLPTVDQTIFSVINQDP